MLTILYSFIPLVSLVGYFSQVRVLVIHKEKASSISLSSWVLWLVMSLVSLGVWGVLSSRFLVFNGLCYELIGLSHDYPFGSL